MVGQVLVKFLAYIEIVIWMWGICQTEFKRKKIVVIYGMLALLATFLLVWIESKCGVTVYTAFVIIIIQIILNSVIFEGKFIHNVIKSFFSSVYIDIIYLPIRTFYSLLDLDKFSIFLRYHNSILSIIVICCVCFIGLQIKKHKEWVRWIQNIPVGYFVLGFLFAFSANGISNFISYNNNDTWSRQTQIVIKVLQTILTVFLYFFGVAIAVINLLKENYKRENILKDEYLRMSKEHYNKVKEHMGEVQRIRHDMKHHMNMLKTFIEKKDLEKASQYLRQIEEHQQWHNKPMVNIGNELVDAVLNNGLEHMNPDIAFECEGVLPQILEIQEFDLCTIFSNLLSNSIEACEKLTNHKKVIILSIRSFQDDILISMKNPVEEDIKKENLGKISTKKDKVHHGYGILNITDTVEKYGGTVDFVIENNWFEVKICL